MSLRPFLAAGALACLGAPAAAQQSSQPWRPTVMARHGMVASGHPLASQAGMRILLAGGNAMDAALAAWLVQGQVEPGMTGLGADLFVLYYDAKTRTVHFVNGSGPAPARATADFYRALGGMPEAGALSVEVPGAVGGALLAHQTYGTLPLATVLEPALEIAEQGFPVSDALAAQLQAHRAKLAAYPSTTKIWFRDGRPLEAGELVTNPDLAATLRLLAQGGADAFYRGPIAQRAVAFLQANGGIHQASDWANYRAHEDRPIAITYRGIEVYECPPNSQGHVMLQALQLLEGFDLQALGHNTAAYLHLVTEALKLAFADRNAYNGDPRRVPPIPLADLLSPEYAAARRALIRPDRAIAGEAPAGDPRTRRTPQPPAYSDPQPLPAEVRPLEEASALDHTTYLAVVDRDRNLVSITSSILSVFGSGMVAEGLGFFLNNRMAYFSLEPGDPNYLEPGKRTRQTINPALALKDGRPFLVFGTPGADTQPQTQLQFFLNVVEFGMGVQQALEQPAVISTSFRSSYYPHRIAGTLLAPAALPREVLEGLAARGHRLELRAVRGVGSVKAIMIHPRTGALMGGASPTLDAYVIGWN